jgi:hypothetical protein
MKKQNNNIDNIRNEIKKYFDPLSIKEDTRDSFFSPDKKYRIETIEYHQNKSEVNWDITNVVVKDNITGEKLFDFFCNYGQFFHGWIEKNDIQYLVCAEDLYGGQTIIDLNNRKMQSYSPGIDGYIWTEFHISPLQDVLATFGCIWAWPYQIRLYDFRNPMNLPLKEIKGIEIEDDMDFIEWIDNYKFKGRTVDGINKIVNIEDLINGFQELNMKRPPQENE